MKSIGRSTLRISFVLGVVAVGIYSLLASGGGGTNPPRTWFTGLHHSTVWGAFAVPNTTAPAPVNNCQSNTPPRIEPQDWWNAQLPTITDHTDAVGTTIWSSTDLTCPRALQTLYRSVLVADLSNFYTQLPAGTTQVGNRISKATLEFNVIPMTPTNPLNFPCDPAMGSAGMVNVLQRNAVVTQGSTNVPVGTGLQAGLIQASPSPGPFDGPHVIASFPVVGDMAANLGLVTGPGTFANGSLVIVQTGAPFVPTGANIYDVKIDVLKWVRGAANLNMPSIGFSVAGINEATITVSSVVQFACRTWVEPIQLNVEFQ